MPDRFLVHIVAENWACTPEEARRSRADDFFDSLLFHSARERGRADKAANERASQGK